MISLDSFRADAAAWLSANAAEAPPDYGAICPPNLVEAGVVWHRRLHHAGYTGIHWPVGVGGRGLTPEHNAIWQLECATAGVPAAFNMVGLVLTAQALLGYGSREQQTEHLPRTASGEHLWCQLFSEPGSGSDLASLSTRADLDGDRYVVNGQKVWCSGARYSHWGILLARTDHDVPQHQGISFFLIDMSTPGVEIRPLRQMTGEAEFDEVFFADVSVPITDLLGPLHGGWGVAMSVLTNERGHIGTAVVGLERRLEQMAAFAGGRELDPVRRQDLAELHRARNRVPIARAAPGGRGDDCRFAPQARHHGDVLRRRDAASRSGGRRLHPRRARGIWHAGRTRRENRRRYQPGPAQHHRRTTARFAASAERVGDES